MVRRRTPTITPPPNGTMMYVAGVLGGLASGSERPPGFERYFGTEGADQLYEAFQRIDSLLIELCNAGIGDGSTTTVRFDGP